MGRKDFCGEVWTNTHPEIMNAIMMANMVSVDGKVGNDGYSKQAILLMQKYFDTKISAVYAYNGTAANILALKSMLKPYGSVISADCTHINTHECGATEYMLGNKILAIPSADGKLCPRMIEDYLDKIKNYKYIPQVLAITQPTELGVLYTKQELRALCEYAHSKGMYVYLDGARITNALVALDTDLHSMIEESGIDAFSFGGTKAGLMFGEMVVFLNGNFSEHLAYSQKQSLQHMDKSKFLGVQFEYLLRTELWKKTAAYANEMAKLLEKKLMQKGIVPYYPVDTNMVFCRLAEDQYDRVLSAFDLHYWDEDQKIVRFALTHETSADVIEELVSLL